MQKYNCIKCDEEFTDIKKYEIHVKTEPCIVHMYINKYNYDTYDKLPKFISEHVNFKQMLLGNQNYKSYESNEVKTDEDENIYKCKFCDNVFSRADSLSRHTKKFCKVKKILEPLKKLNLHLIDERTKYNVVDIDEILKSYFSENEDEDDK